MMGFLKYGDNNWVSVELLADKKTFVGTTDTQTKVKMDIETLETDDWVKFTDNLGCITGVAHSHTQPDGTVLSMCHSLNMGHLGMSYFLNFYKMTPEDPFNRQLITRIPMKNLHYFHSFAVTENYAIIVQGPVYFKDMVARMMQGKMIEDIMTTDYDASTLFHIINLKDGSYQTIDIFRLEAWKFQADEQCLGNPNVDLK